MDYKIEKSQVFGFQASIRGMRNPLDSWDRSDSCIRLAEFCRDLNTRNLNDESFRLGEKDAELSRKLFKGGSEHCKHLRMIHVWLDLTLPRYIWTEFDTYKFHTRCSCSTMHTAMKKEITLDNFSGDSLFPDDIYLLNQIIDMYQKSKSAEERRFLKTTFKERLPESFLQKSTICTNYAELVNIYLQRKNHQLQIWRDLCKWIINLPYFQELTGITK